MRKLASMIRRFPWGIASQTSHGSSRRGNDGAWMICGETASGAGGSTTGKAVAPELPANLRLEPRN